MQRLLQINDDLAPIGKHNGHHAACSLVVQIGNHLVVDSVAIALNGFKQHFGLVHEFGIGHYNFAMLKSLPILVSASVLVAGAMSLSACGQRGPLYLPSGPTATATLPAAPASMPVKP